MRNLTEAIRALGLLYEPNIPLINTLLKTGLEILEKSDDKVKFNPIFLYFIKTIFDIIFHQVGIDKEFENVESDELTRELYIEVVTIILDDEKFHDLTGFNSVIYFILMITWDNHYQDEFMNLWNQIQPYLDSYGRDDPISESWIFYFKELESKNNS